MKSMQRMAHKDASLTILVPRDGVGTAKYYGWFPCDENGEPIETPTLTKRSKKRGKGSRK